MVRKIIMLMRLSTGEDVSVTVKSVDKEPDKTFLYDTLVKWLREYNESEILYFTVRRWDGKTKNNWKFKTSEELEAWLHA